jgi:Putative prokaryotic signal transducing protein
VSATAVAAVANSTFEAQLIVGMLEASGINATVSADDAGGMEPQWQLTEGVRVIVSTEDVARARELIAEREKQ